MKISVVISTIASFYIGEVEVDSKDEYLKAANDLWGEKDYDMPTLCHQCADIELGDFEIDETSVDNYFKQEQENDARECLEDG